jgi:uncharacterized protein (TIGR02452 family)
MEQPPGNNRNQKMLEVCMNRFQRAKVAEETISILERSANEILERGDYEVAGHRVSIRSEIDRCNQQTQLFSPADLDKLVGQVSPQLSQTTTFQVRNETTLQGAQRLWETGHYSKIAALNFASAKNPGGGFRSGSEAQEESLARNSALYSSLLMAPSYYEYHRAHRSALYSHHMILSPGCPVFRNDDGALIPSYPITFITSPAPNAGAIQAFAQASANANNSPGSAGQLLPTLQARALRILTIAAHTQAEALVLGAWGCGVFRNDPLVVAQVFAELIQPSGIFANCFETVVFSVLDRSAAQSTYGAFADLFSAP